ncbi:thiosulfate sulfurtransferase [Mycolicibacterium litorale]|nr:thiosulfate sulfurtransferase [Mycolicibacterium litorale]
MTTVDHAAPPEDIDADAAVRLASDASALLLDVREDDEWMAGHAPGAVHVRLGDVDPAAFDRRVPIVAICRSGNRSRAAALKLAGAGLAAYNLDGGMKAWQDCGRPVVRDDGGVGTVV